MTRREALAVVSTGLFSVRRAQELKPSAGRTLEPPPAGVTGILKRLLAQPPSTINTDWFGTMILVGALRWHHRVPEVEAFALAWLTHHLNTTDVAPYSGNRSRTVRAGGIPLTTYAGHFGMSQVCEQLVVLFGNQRAREVAVDVANIVLHRTARNRLGLIAHDDTADFAIPDVTFLAVSSLMIGAALDSQNATAYRNQALYELRTSIETFLMKDIGLARTVYRNGGIGRTSWTRASGWLLWAITAMLGRLDAKHSAFTGFKSDLRTLADGMSRVQEPSGGFHVLLDDPSTPLDVSGPAMFALAVHESVRRGWLPRQYLAAALRAWHFVAANLTDDGVLHNTYDLWALPAEKREMRVRDVESGWAMGFVLAAAHEMTL